MEDGLKSNWKKVGKDFANLGKDLGKTLMKTVKTGVAAASDWANEPKDAAQQDAVIEADELVHAAEDEPKA